MITVTDTPWGVYTALPAFGNVKGLFRVRERLRTIWNMLCNLRPDTRLNHMPSDGMIKTQKPGYSADTGTARTTDAVHKQVLLVLPHHSRASGR